MYYIVNQDKQLIATDNDFLSLLGFDSLQELFSKTASGELNFAQLDTNTIEIATELRTLRLTQNKYPLSTVMGDVMLIEVLETEEASLLSADLMDTSDDDVIFSISDENDEKEDDKDFILFDTEPQEEIKIEKAVNEEVNLAVDKDADDSFPINDKEEDFIKLNVEPEEKEEEVANDDIINLLPDEEVDFLKPAEKTLAEEEEEEEILLPTDANILIDTDKISKMLGISKEDYSSFLNEFIDKAIEEEEAIKDVGSAEHLNAISSLHNLSQMLHLSELSAILEKVDKTSGKKEKKAIESFYHTLSNLTTLPDEPDSLVTEPEEISYDNQICDLILDQVKPIHFDFQAKQASEELGLPIDLIEEFVHDFIGQAIEEKQTFIDACRQGDIDTIHKTGHKLKGAASNLRIVPLADTLEELQFCEDKDRFEPLFKKYWGQFLALEHMMSNTSNQKQGEK